MDETQRPLIVTLRMPRVAQEILDALRQAHFPPSRNVLSAHVTLFHALPAQSQAFVEACLAETAATIRSMTVEVSSVRFTGAGVALVLTSAALCDLRRRLATAFSSGLTPQDRQGFRPHITLQNKVLPQTARALHHSLSTDFAPWSFEAAGLQLWRYEGGPWSAIAEFAFGDNDMHENKT